MRLWLCSAGSRDQMGWDREATGVEGDHMHSFSDVSRGAAVAMCHDCRSDCTTVGVALCVTP